MLNHAKYQRPQHFQFLQRTWPGKIACQAPRWCSVDLRDGNQALVEPMSVEQKLDLFSLLVDIGFKDIEIGFPSASQIDYDFARQLIEDNHIPDDVCIQVLVQAREELIAKTFAALEGAKQAIVHVYNSTSPLQRQRVFNKTEEDITQLAVQGAQWLVDYANIYLDTQWHFQYSPESFSQTEMPFALSVCNAVLNVFQPNKKRRVIINLPATVEATGPHEFADQVEFISSSLIHRNAVELCVHTHNDRGCAVAAAELACLAGADRVEGTLFGNGERTGNMDVITLAMNYYSHGIDPVLDLSQVERMAEVYQRCCNMPISPRHPWVGELVYTAFSGSHQDAIKKTMALQQQDEPWQVAYLPIDPKDLGRDYQAIIQVNSQSGKGGISWLLQKHFGIELPRNMLVEFSQKVQAYTDANQGVVDKDILWYLLNQHYFAQDWVIEHLNLQNINGKEQLTVHGSHNNQAFVISQQGEGVLNTWLDALQRRWQSQVEVVQLKQYSQNRGNQSQAIAVIEAFVNGQTRYALGMDKDTAKAPLLAACALV